MGLVDTAGDTNYLNDTVLFLTNATLNGTRLGNFSYAAGPETDDKLTELIVMIITSVLLGCMILITVIGKFGHIRNLA